VTPSDAVIFKKMDYLNGHSKSGIKVGDKVKVLRRAKNHQDGWDNIWADSMDKSVGLVFQVVRDDGVAGFWLSDYYRYPYFVLEKVGSGSKSGLALTVGSKPKSTSVDEDYFGLRD
jgi:hypothetical protein